MSLSEQRYKECLVSLQKYWGYDAFRPGQDQAIRSVCEGQKTLVVFPTSAGKSLCYQVPAVTFEGLCLVISPLLALMEDQVKQQVLGQYGLLQGVRPEYYGGDSYLSQLGLG